MKKPSFEKLDYIMFLQAYEGLFFAGFIFCKLFKSFLKALSESVLVILYFSPEKSIFLLFWVRLYIGT
ncbi:hypothetical protein EO97_01040 [Methanosarcina sp. 2.H.T.1A.15]|nr:hypothetical protein EO97_01040 [Methanosarcina sp. 2.H.T.1A.15]KKG25374.1 hypothetical protein EO96_00090 [Methanosarcina sp. 2.H.T.1A.8]